MYKVFLWSDQIGANNCKNWVFKLKRFLDVNNLANLFVPEDVEGKSIIDQCKERFQVLENNKWFHNLWDDRKNVNGNKLRTYRLFKTELLSEEYLNINMPRQQRAAFVKLRCGVLPLEIETGRYNRVPLENRKCKLCNLDVVESEKHFLTECPLYDDIRFTMFQKALQVDDTFNSKDKSGQMCFLLGCNQISSTVIKCVDKMFNRRKMFVTKK
jgi:hypothetical protein